MLEFFINQLIPHTVNVQNSLEILYFGADLFLMHIMCRIFFYTKGCSVLSLPKIAHILNLKCHQN